MIQVISFPARSRGLTVPLTGCQGTAVFAGPTDSWRAGADRIDTSYLNYEATVLTYNIKTNTSFNSYPKSLNAARLKVTGGQRPKVSPGAGWRVSVAAYFSLHTDAVA